MWRDGVRPFLSCRSPPTSLLPCQAEYLHQWPISYDHIERMCHDRGVPIIVVVKDSLQRHNATLRVRTLDGRHDDDVRLSAVAAHVVQLLVDVAPKSRTAELRTESAALARAMAKLDVSGSGAAGERDKQAKGACGVEAAHVPCAGVAHCVLPSHAVVQPKLRLPRPSLW